MVARCREIAGVGAPKSEIWVDRYATMLRDPIVLAVGEALNVAAGLVPRAPALMQRFGLEWLFRFAHAPQRLFGRYFLRSWRFLWIAATARRFDVPGTAWARAEPDRAWTMTGPSKRDYTNGR